VAGTGKKNTQATFGAAGVVLLFTVANVVRESYRRGSGLAATYHWHLHISTWSWVGLVAAVVLAGIGART
jgi:hypothetical protein